MFFFLIVSLLFTYVWAYAYNPLVLDHHSVGCIPAVSTSVSGSNTQTTTTWATIQTGQTVPQPACTPKPNNNAFTVITVVQITVEQDPQVPRPYPLDENIPPPCAMDNTPNGAHQFLIIVADSNCTVTAFWRTPPTGRWPRLFSDRYQGLNDNNPDRMIYQGPLWALEGAPFPSKENSPTGAPMLMIFTCVGYEYTRTDPLNPAYTAAYGDAEYSFECDHWDNSPQNWWCATSFPLDGKKANIGNNVQPSIYTPPSPPS